MSVSCYRFTLRPPLITHLGDCDKGESSSSHSSRSTCSSRVRPSCCNNEGLMSVSGDETLNTSALQPWQTWTLFTLLWTELNCHSASSWPVVKLILHLSCRFCSQLFSLFVQPFKTNTQVTTAFFLLQNIVYATTFTETSVICALKRLNVLRIISFICCLMFSFCCHSYDK